MVFRYLSESATSRITREALNFVLVKFTKSLAPSNALLGKSQVKDTLLVRLIIYLLQHERVSLNNTFISLSFCISRI